MRCRRHGPLSRKTRSWIYLESPCDYSWSGFVPAVKPRAQMSIFCEAGVWFMSLFRDRWTHPPIDSQAWRSLGSGRLRNGCRCLEL